MKKQAQPTAVIVGAGITCKPVAEPSSFYYQIEDRYNNFSEVLGPHVTIDAAMKDCAEAIEEGGIGNVDIDEDAIEDVSIVVYEVRKTLKYTAEKAGVKLTERK